MNLYKIALRNISRNKKRTTSTILSISIAIIVAIFLRSLQEGSYKSMIDESIGQTFGYLQIQNKDYFDDKTIDNAMEFSPELLENINSINTIKAVTPHIESGALASSGSSSKPVMVMSFYPRDKDSTMINHMKIISGHILSKNDDGVLLSDELAKYLKLNTGDTLILIGQGYQGLSAAGLFPVRGTIHSPNIQINNKLIYMSVLGMQNWLALPDNLVNYIAINISDQDKLLSIQKALTKKLVDTDYIIKNWKEINPDIARAIEGDRKGGIAIIYLLYLIVFFGLLGTMLMTINERRREFSVNIAIGMRKSQIKLILLIEMIASSLIGIVLALIIDIPIILYLTFHPITFTGNMAAAFTKLGYTPVMPGDGLFPYTWQQIIIVLLMVILSVFISYRKINKIRISDSLHIQ